MGARPILQLLLCGCCHKCPFGDGKSRAMQMFNHLPRNGPGRATTTTRIANEHQNQNTRDEEQKKKKNAHRKKMDGISEYRFIRASLSR